MLLIIAGPSCSGKTTTIKALVEKYGATMVVRETTRPPREDEEDVGEYLFVETINRDKMIDIEEHRGWYYGLPYADYSDGVHVVVACPSSARRIRENSESEIIYIKVDQETRVRRSIADGRDVDEVYRRSASDVDMFENFDNDADLVINNCKFEKSADEIAAEIFEYYKDVFIGGIVARLCNKRSIVYKSVLKNGGITKDWVSDMTIIYRLPNGNFVQQYHLQNMGLGIEDLQEAAENNARGDTAVHWMSDLLGIQDDDMMVVIMSGKTGAFPVTINSYMEYVSNEYFQGQDMMIFPSSIHEVIALPAISGLDLRKAATFTAAVNRDCVAKEIRLSDTALYYSSDTKKVTSYLSREAKKQKSTSG